MLWMVPLYLQNAVAFASLISTSRSRATGPASGAASGGHGSSRRCAWPAACDCTTAGRSVPCAGRSCRGPYTAPPETWGSPGGDRHADFGTRIYSRLHLSTIAIRSYPRLLPTFSATFHGAVTRHPIFWVELFLTNSASSGYRG